MVSSDGRSTGGSCRYAIGEKCIEFAGAFGCDFLGGGWGLELWSGADLADAVSPFLVAHSSEIRQTTQIAFHSALSSPL